MRFTFLVFLALLANGVCAASNARLDIDTDVGTCNLHGQSVGHATWSADPHMAGAAQGFQLRLDGPTGKLIANVGPSGTRRLGSWVKNGMRFVLIRRSDGAELARSSARTSFPACYPAVTFEMDASRICQGNMTVSGRVNWDFRPSNGQNRVKVFVQSRDGTEKPFSGGGARGTARMGNWVTPDTVLVFRDVQTGRLLDYQMPHPLALSGSSASDLCPQIRFEWKAPGPLDCSFSGRSPAALRWNTRSAGYDKVSIWVNGPGDGSNDWRLMRNSAGAGETSDIAWLHNGHRFLLRDRTSGTQLGYLVARPDPALCAAVDDIQLPADIASSGWLRPFHLVSVRLPRPVSALSFHVHTDGNGRVPMDIVSTRGNVAVVRVPPIQMPHGDVILTGARSASIIATARSASGTDTVVAASPVLRVTAVRNLLPPDLAPGAVTEIWMRRMQASFASAKLHTQAFAHAGVALGDLNLDQFDDASTFAGELADAAARISQGLVHSVSIGTTRFGAEVVIDRNTLFNFDNLLLNAYQDLLWSGGATSAARTMAASPAFDSPETLLDEWRELITRTLPNDILNVSRTTRTAIGVVATAGVLVASGPLTAGAIVSAAAVGSMTALLAPAALALALEGGGKQILDGQADLSDFRTTLEFAGDSLTQMVTGVLNQGLTQRLNLSDRLSAISSNLIEGMIGFTRGTPDQPGLVERLQQIPNSFRERFIDAADDLGLHDDDDDNWPAGYGELVVILHGATEGYDSESQSIIDQFGHDGSRNIPVTGTICYGLPSSPQPETGTRSLYSDSGVSVVNAFFAWREVGYVGYRIIPYTCRNRSSGRDIVHRQYLRDTWYGGSDENYVSILIDASVPWSYTQEDYPIRITSEVSYRDDRVCGNGSLATLRGDRELTWSVSRDVFKLPTMSPSEARQIITDITTGMGTGGICSAITIGHF